MTKTNHKSGLILIKYGGNAMQDDDLTHNIISKVATLGEKGYKVVMVHGGGPFIEDILDLAGIGWEFAEGHRKTSGEAMKYIEMALKGHVNGKLVRLLNEQGLKAVGLSGKDGHIIKVRKRYPTDYKGNKIDIGFVGDVERIKPSLPRLLVRNGYIPVISTISMGSEDGLDYNVNADMFAGFLAGVMKVEHFIMLTDVDGLMKDPSDPSSLITEVNVSEMDDLYKDVIKGGMIPKTEACETAVELGAASALIINGTKPERLLESVTKSQNLIGTRFVK